MNKLSKTEKDILCANHDWQNCRLSDDGLDIEAVQNNPSNPENIGEWINMGQLVDYDDELDELSQDEPDPETIDQIEKQILDEINQKEGRNYQSVTFLSPDDYDKKYEYWGHPRQYSIDGDEFEIGQYCEIGEDEDTAELIACIFENEPEPETVDLSEILENIKSGKYTEHEMTELPVAGDPPKGNHLGVWSWNGKQAIVGYSIDDFEIVDYGYFDDGPEPEDSSNDASTYRIIGQLTYTESEETEDGFKTIEIDEIFKCDAENLTTVLEMFLSAHPEYIYFGTLRGCDPETHGKNYASFYDPNENQIIKVKRNS